MKLSRLCLTVFAMGLVAMNFSTFTSLLSLIISELDRATASDEVTPSPTIAPASLEKRDANVVYGSHNSKLLNKRNNNLSETVETSTILQELDDYNDKMFSKDEARRSIVGKDGIIHNPFTYPGNIEMTTMIAILVYVGAFFGCWMFAGIATFFGRQPALIILAIIAAGSHVSVRVIGSDSPAYFVVLGIAGGGSIPVLIAYTSEISPPKIRGAVMASVASMINFAILFEYLFSKWTKMVYLIASIFSVLLAMGVTVESPYYYFTKGKLKKAKTTFETLRKKECKDEEIEAMYLEVKSTRNVLDYLLTKRFCRTLILGICLFIFQLFAIANALYIIEVWREEVDLLPKTDTAIIISLILISSLCPPLIIDNFKRKSLLLFTTLGMLISEIILIVVYIFLVIAEYDVHAGFHLMPNLIFFTYMICYNFGIGTLAWIMMGEIYAIKTKCCAIAFTVCFFYAPMVWLQRIVYYLIKYLHIWGFFILLMMWMIFLWFINGCIVETGQRGLEAIQEEIRQSMMPRQSHHGRPGGRPGRGAGRPRPMVGALPEDEEEEEEYYHERNWFAVFKPTRSRETTSTLSPT